MDFTTPFQNSLTGYTGLYLLWQIGIAHCDLSFWNLMFDASGGTIRAILIDFDHAIVVEPGTHFLDKPGADMIGTKPFRAFYVGVDVDYIRKVKRAFYHDLESILWCIVWYCQPQPTWLAGGWADVMGQKSSWADRAELDKPPQDLRDGSVEVWRGAVQAAQEWKVAIYSEPKTDQQWLDVIHSHIPCPESVGRDWMTFNVNPDQEPRTSGGGSKRESRSPRALAALWAMIEAPTPSSSHSSSPPLNTAPS